MSSYETPAPAKHHFELSPPPPPMAPARSKQEQSCGTNNNFLMLPFPKYDVPNSSNFCTKPVTQRVLNLKPRPAKMDPSSITNDEDIPAFLPCSFSILRGQPSSLRHSETLSNQPVLSEDKLSLKPRPPNKQKVFQTEMKYDTQIKSQDHATGSSRGKVKNLETLPAPLYPLPSASLGPDCSTCVRARSA